MDSVVTEMCRTQSRFSQIFYRLFYAKCIHILRPSDKPFESLKEDVFMEVSTLIAANESRPQFLINLFRELQLISATDPLRDSLMDAFHELYNRYYFPNNCLGDEQRTVPSAPVVAANNWPENEMPQSQGPSNSLGKNNGFSSTGRTQTVSEFLNQSQ